MGFRDKRGFKLQEEEYKRFHKAIRASCVFEKEIRLIY